MAKLVMVRHGQASFFSDDYDKLSDLGVRQAEILGEYWTSRDLAPDAVFSGRLERQRHTAELVGSAYQSAGKAWPGVQTDVGLDEYPADEIMKRLLPVLCESDEHVARLSDELGQAVEMDTRFRAIHRLLEAVLAHWVRGTIVCDDLVSWEDWSGGVRGAIRRIVDQAGNGKRVVVFSSGGPVGVTVQTVLSAPDLVAAELNWRVHNCSLTEFTFSGERMSLDCFNAVPHLAEPELLTYR